MAKIYTKTGDNGQTALGGGQRVSKAHPRIEVYGTLDELNAVLGLALSHIQHAAVAIQLAQIQSELFAMGSVIANPGHSQAWLDEKWKTLPEKVRLTPDCIERMEKSMDDFTATLPPLTAFIIPGGSHGAGFLHLARTICRRVERQLVALAANEPAPPFFIIYLNRLSDLLFVLARVENRQQGVADITW